jgi:hypothetical protein
MEEPRSVDEAVQDPRWLAALRSEYDAMVKNRVWSPVPDDHPEPPDDQVVGLTAKFKVK